MTNRDRVIEAIRADGRAPISTFLANQIADRIAAEGLIAPDSEAIRAKITSSVKRLQPFEVDALVKALS